MEVYIYWKSCLGLQTCSHRVNGSLKGGWTAELLYTSGWLGRGAVCRATWRGGRGVGGGEGRARGLSGSWEASWSSALLAPWPRLESRSRSPPSARLAHALRLLRPAVGRVMRATLYRGAYANSGVVGSIAARSLVSCAQQTAVPPTRSELAVAGVQDMALRAEYRAWRQGSAASMPRRTAGAPSLPSAPPTVVAPAKPSKAVPRLLRDFTPGRVLGRGAFGVVVSARSKTDPLAEYAIKMVAWPADVDAAALGEVRAMASLPPSRNLVGYHGAWVEAGGEWVSELSACVSESTAASASDPGAGQTSALGLLALASGSSPHQPAARRAAASSCILPLSGSSSSCSCSDSTCSLRSCSATQLIDASAASLPGLCLASALIASPVLTRGVGAWLFLQMEMVPFPTLAHWLRGDGMAAVPAATRWRWVEGAAAGLEVVHAAGWVHNDVKPANLFCCPRTGATKLADFGSCVRAGSAASSGGTPAYAAPERYTPAGVAVSGSSDIFSLGVCVAEIFGGFSTGMERARVVMRLMEPSAAAGSGAAGLRAGGEAGAPVHEAQSPIGVASGIARRMLSRYEGERPLAGDLREEASELAALA